MLIVDAANVVGSVPDGWWRDRRGATVRLRDALAGLAGTGLPGVPAPVEVVLVVEGVARGVASRPEVRVARAPDQAGVGRRRAGSGDDEIVALVAAAAGRAVWVVTADRGLRERVNALGARVLGPRTVRPAPDRPEPPRS